MRRQYPENLPSFSFTHSFLYLPYIHLQVKENQGCGNGHNRYKSICQNYRCQCQALWDCHITNMHMTWLKRSVAGLSPRSYEFRSRLVHVGFGVDKVPPRVSVKVLKFSLSVSFHQYSTFIHPSPTLYNLSNRQRRYKKKNKQNRQMRLTPFLISWDLRR